MNFGFVLVSCSALSIAIYALLDFKESASWMTALANGILASGNPSIFALSIAAWTKGPMFGLASPMSS